MLLPRYVRVAHILLEEKTWLTSREVAVLLAISPRAISDDFAAIRRRPDIFEFDEKTEFNKGKKYYLMRIFHIYPYVLDGRRCPQLAASRQEETRPSIEWRDLLSHHWHALDLRYLKKDGQ